MKKALITLLISALLLCALPVSMAESYSATATGFAGDVTVTLTIDGEQLTDVVIEGANETPTIGGMAIEQIAAAMLERNSVEVDGVAGATMSSTAALTAASQALAESGAILSVKDVDESATPAAEDETTDVLVIGGGSAGVSAAVAAYEAGAKVILVEKLSFLGGCASMSGGVFTRGAVESDEGPVMSSEELYNFLMETAEYKADESLIRYYADHSIDTFNWVYGKMIKNPESAHRFPMIPEGLVSPQLPGAGVELMQDMIDYAQGLDIDIRTQTAATEFIVEDGRVVGAVVTLPNGGTQKIYAKGGVVLACGGFASSPEKLAMYSTPGAEHIKSMASAGTVGDGLEMAKAVNAEISFNDDWDTCGAFFSSTLVYDGYDASKFFNMAVLNSEGKRFMNEANGMTLVYTDMRHELAKGVENKFWFLTDTSIEGGPEFLVEYQGAQVAQNIEELAAITGLSVEVLQTTIDEYNALAGTDNDPFGKPGQYNLGLKAPYIVYADEPMRTTTIGGLKINDKAQTLDVNGAAIPGLYAAGEVANANFYYTTYTCGTAVGSSIVFGRAAGTNAAQEALSK